MLGVFAVAREPGTSHTCWILRQGLEIFRLDWIVEAARLCWLSSCGSCSRGGWWVKFTSLLFFISELVHSPFGCWENGLQDRIFSFLFLTLFSQLQAEFLLFSGVSVRLTFISESTGIRNLLRALRRDFPYWLLVSFSLCGKLSYLIRVC